MEKVNIGDSKGVNLALITFLLCFNTICFAAGFITFIYGVCLNATSYNTDQDIRKIMLETRLNQNGGAYLRFLYDMPVSGALTTVYPFAQAIVAFILYKKHGTLISCKWPLWILIIVYPILSCCLMSMPMVTLEKVPTLKQEIALAFQATLKSDYRSIPDGWSNDDPLNTEQEMTMAWDDLMLRERCCGSTGQENFLSATSGDFLATRWRSQAITYKLSNGSQYQNSQYKIPMACCKVKKDFLKENEKIDITSLQSNLESESCPVDLSQSATTGCLTTVLEKLSSYAIWTSVIILIIGFMYDTLFIIALVLFLRMRREMKEVNDVTSNKA